MNTNKFSSLSRQLRSFSSHNRRSSRITGPPLPEGILQSVLNGQHEMRRQIHGVQLSHFILFDRAASSSLSKDQFFKGIGGNLLLERSIPFSDECRSQFSYFHTQVEDAKENNLNPDFVNPQSKLKAEFETAKLCFNNIPSALKEMTKMNPAGVYANHNLRLDLIDVYGFDYDYTLAHYTPDLQTLIYELAKERLVKEHRYPESCLNFEYDKGFPIRGLYYDKNKGYLLKLDFFHSIEREGCFFGRRKVDKAEVESAYGGRRISEKHHKNLVSLMDLFCLSEVCLISDVIQHFVDQKVAFDPSYVYEDVKSSVEHVHRSGLLHKEILKEPAKYLVKSQGVVQMLRNLKNAGKILFLLTNSKFPFVDGGMRYMFQEDDGSGASWRDLFDVVIAQADKPNFYTSKRPFRYYDTRKDLLAFRKVDAFQKHSVYYHGCLKHFLEITKWQGHKVIYFGDNLYSDLRGPAEAGWRTAAIIRELEREIQTQNEDTYRFLQAKYNIIQEFLGEFHGLSDNHKNEEDEKQFLSTLREERRRARAEMRALFNPYFGSTFLTDKGKESAFSYNVQRYADVYTSKLENFLTLSVEAWLYTPFDVKILPHHIKVSPATLLHARLLPSKQVDAWQP